MDAHSQKEKKKRKRPAKLTVKQQELPPPKTTPGLRKRFFKNDAFNKEIVYKHHHRLIIDQWFSP
jgi:hypothetical protein